MFITMCSSYSNQVVIILSEVTLGSREQLRNRYFGSIVSVLYWNYMLKDCEGDVAHNIYFKED